MTPAREAAEQAGRDPDALVIAMTGIALLASDRLGQLRERLQRAREAGVDHAIVGLHPAELKQAPAAHAAIRRGSLRRAQGVARGRWGGWA